MGKVPAWVVVEVECPFWSRWVCSPEHNGGKSIVQYQEFLHRVEEQIAATQPSSDTQQAAESAITATLETLSERLTGGEVNDIAAQLPAELQASLQRTAEEEAEDFSLEEFYGRVAEREGVDIQTAREDASAVMTVLRLALTSGQLDDVMAQLPEEFNALFR
jgi:uncharacterized protein (DUF2267 family)